MNKIIGKKYKNICINILRILSLVFIGYSIGSLIVLEKFWLSIILVVPAYYIIFFTRGEK